MLAILSDIHGNYPALIAVLRRVDELGCERIVSLGDVAGYYAQPNECIEELRARNVPSLMGNHDHYLLTGAACPRSRSANDCLTFQRRVIKPSSLEWLTECPKTLQTAELNMVHAGWKDSLEEYLPDPEEIYFRGLPGSIFLSGHTHVPMIRAFGYGIYANPGSVGQPRDGDARAAFGVENGGRITIERVAYDVDATAYAMRNAGFEDYYYRNLYIGRQIGYRAE